MMRSHTGAVLLLADCGVADQCALLHFREYWSTVIIEDVGAGCFEFAYGASV